MSQHQTVRGPIHLLALALALLLGASGCSIFADVDPDQPGVQTDPTARTLGTRLDDSRIESLAATNIAEADEALHNAHISVIAHNGVVLLMGQVPSEELKSRAEQETARVDKVRRIYNELEVSGPTSMLVRSSDSVITAKVKSKLVASEDVPGTGINVSTENGVVYMMGLIRRRDADAAVEIARNTGGVRRVVRVFEYVD